MSRKGPLADLFLGWWENYLDWSGHISVCNFKWVHFMYVNSSSIKLIMKEEKGAISVLIYHRDCHVKRTDQR